MKQPDMFNELDPTAHARTLANQLSMTLVKVTNPQTVEDLTINQILRNVALIRDALDADMMSPDEAETRLLKLQAQALGADTKAKPVTAQDLDTPALLAPEDLGELF